MAGATSDKRRRRTDTRPATLDRASPTSPPRRLAGGNPQIPKGDGDAPVQAFIAAMPGWQRAVGARIDALVARAVPGVTKAVKYNSPLYGAGDGTWFLSMHCYTRYLKVAFFRGAALDPPPPGASKTKHTRYLDLHEHDPLDERQFVSWLRQASRLPGEKL